MDRLHRATRLAPAKQRHAADPQQLGGSRRAALFEQVTHPSRDVIAKLDRSAATGGVFGGPRLQRRVQFGQQVRPGHARAAYVDLTFRDLGVPVLEPRVFFARPTPWLAD